MVLLYLLRNLKGWNFSTEAIVQTLIGYTIDEGVGYLRRYTPQQTKFMLQMRGFRNFRGWNFVHISLGIVSLLSVKIYAMLIRGKQEREKVVSGKMLLFIKFIFKLFELIGRFEAFLLWRLPGAGFFIQTDLRD